MDPSKYSTYTIEETDSWPLISYKFYQTIELWWLICKFNNIKDPFKELEPGNIIKIPSDEIKDVILDTIGQF